MTKSEAYRQMRTLFSRFFDDNASVRRIAMDAGLDISRLNLTGSPTNVWHGVMSEAEKHGKLASLVQVAVEEYPSSTEEFSELLRIYLPANQGKPAAQSPPPRVDQSSMPPPRDRSIEPQQPSDEGAEFNESSVPQIPITMPRDMKISQVENQILCAMFTGSIEVMLIKEFTDGRTETRVFLVQPTDAEGVKVLPAVAKIGPKPLIEKEWQADQRHLLNRLPGFAPVQGTPVYLHMGENQSWGGLRYGQVGDGLFDIVSLSDYIKDESSLYNIWHLLENRLFRQLGELWQATIKWETLKVKDCYDQILPVNLMIEPSTLQPNQSVIWLDGRQIAQAGRSVGEIQLGSSVRLENFVVTEIDIAKQEVTLNLPLTSGNPPTLPSYRLRVQPVDGSIHLAIGDILPPVTGLVTLTRQGSLQREARAYLNPSVDLAQTPIALPDVASLAGLGTFFGDGEIALPNPLMALPSLLEHTAEAKFATIHGDLNLRNILVDPQAITAHLIDCASASHNHVLQDLLLLERDILTDLLAQTLFQQGMQPEMVVGLYRYIHCAMQREAHGSGEFAIPTELPSSLHKVYIALVTLRQMARKFLSDPTQWDEYYTGLVIHSLGSLKFKALDKAPIGQNPKAIAFWAAAATVWLMQGNGDCLQIQWQYVDVSGNLKDPEWEEDIINYLISKGEVNSRDLDGLSPERWQEIKREFLIKNPKLDLMHTPQSIRYRKADQLQFFNHLWESIQHTIVNGEKIEESPIDRLIASIGILWDLDISSTTYDNNIDCYCFMMNTKELFPNLRLTKLPLLIFGPKVDVEKRLNITIELIRKMQSPQNSQTGIIISLDNVTDLNRLRQVSERLRDVYSCDVIIFDRDGVLSVSLLKNRADELRKMILGSVDLSILSPYDTTGAVRPDIFFGRESEIRFIIEKSHNNSYAIVGGRKIGKSSLRNYLHLERLPLKGIHSLSISCSQFVSYEDFLNYPLKQGQLSPSFEIPALPKVGALLDSLQGGKPFVLLLDEADKLVTFDKETDWRLFHYLRDLVNSNVVQLLLFGEHKLRAGTRETNAPLYN
ncbi:MAG: AAA family ATPase [Chloroflexota bacterium]